MQEVGGVLVRRLVRRLYASTLVDSDVDYDRSSSHAGDHLLGDDNRRPPTGDQDGTDDEVRLRDRALDRPTVRREGHDPALVNLVDPPQAVDVAVEEQDLGLHALGDPRSVPSHVAGTDDHDASRPYAGDATEQDASRSVWGLQEVRPNLGSDPSGDFAHRREEGQVTRGELHGLVGNPGGPGLEQSLGHAGVGGEVEVGEQDEVRAQIRKLGFLRLLHLADKLRRPRSIRVDHGRSGGGEISVAEGRPGAGPRLDEHLVAERRQSPDAIRRDGDSALRDLHLGRDSDDHDGSAGCWRDPDTAASVIMAATLWSPTARLCERCNATLTFARFASVARTPVYHRGVPLIGGVAALAGSRVAIFGAGMEGQCFARRVGPTCAELVVVDDIAGDPSGLTGPRQAVEAESAGIDVQPPSVLEDRRFDFVVHSPGVSRYDERLAAAGRLGAVVTTPTALFLEDFQDRRVVAVTGSKGKTTTAMLTAGALGAYGLDVALAGNIGRPLTELYDDDAHDVFVVELSSFQAADVTVSPSVGVLTLLAPDHLDWHRNLTNYYEDKLRLFSHRADVPVAVNGCCDEAVARSSWLTGRVLYGNGGPVRLEKAQVVVSDLGPLDLSQFRLLGEHNLLNACGAVTAAFLVTGELPDQKRLERELSLVTAPRSRLEPIGEIDGVSYIDDALASNPEGTVAAVKAFAGRQVALIVGGHDRGLDYAPLAQTIDSSLPQPVVFWIGDAGAAIATALDDISSSVQRQPAPSLEAAVGLASSRPDIAVVLFSPASPTPRNEGSYLDRSRRFRQVAGVGEGHLSRAWTS